VTPADPWTDVPTGMIPLPPVSEPSFELGGRYWWSEGNTHFAFNSSKHGPILGDPTSTLNYDNLIGNAGELTWRARNETNTFAKGFVGAGGLSGGNLADRDFFAGQVKFSDTTSRVSGSSLIYGTIDIGQGFTLIDGASKLTFGPFVGFNYWQETAQASVCATASAGPFTLPWFISMITSPGFYCFMAAPPVAVTPIAPARGREAGCAGLPAPRNRSPLCLQSRIAERSR
jgi:hypothetical protein